MALRAYSLQNHERELFETCANQRRILLARLGEITLEREGLIEQIKTMEERYRTLLGEAVMRNGAQASFQNARIEGANLICDVPDQMPDAPLPLKPEVLINGRDVDGMARAE